MRGSFASACALAAGTMIASTITAGAQMRAPLALSAAQWSRTPVGARVELVVRVRARARATISAELLESRDRNAYAATGTQVVLYLADGMPVLMGGDEDVRPGAIVSVAGVATGKGRADVTRAVVLTGYVHVVPAR
jgi:hypothetical protein